MDSGGGRTDGIGDSGLGLLADMGKFCGVCFCYKVIVEILIIAIVWLFFSCHIQPPILHSPHAVPLSSHAPAVPAHLFHLFLSLSVCNHMMCMC